MQIKATWTGGRAFTAVGNSGHEIKMDATQKAGGHDAAPTPVELLLSALAGCIGIDVTMILKPHLESVKKLDISVDGVRSEELPTAFTAITVTFTVDGDIDAKKVRRAINLGNEKYCTVAASLKANIDYALVLNGELVELQ